MAVCPECKGSKQYMPLVGTAEPCRKCAGTGEVDAAGCEKQVIRPGDPVVSTGGVKGWAAAADELLATRDMTKDAVVASKEVNPFTAQQIRNMVGPRFIGEKLSDYIYSQQGKLEKIHVDDPAVPAAVSTDYRRGFNAAVGKCFHILNDLHNNPPKWLRPELPENIERQILKRAMSMVQCLPVSGSLEESQMLDVDRFTLRAMTLQDGKNGEGKRFVLSEPKPLYGAVRYNAKSYEVAGKLNAHDVYWIMTDAQVREASNSLWDAVRRKIESTKLWNTASTVTTANLQQQRIPEAGSSLNEVFKAVNKCSTVVDANGGWNLRSMVGRDDRTTYFSGSCNLSIAHQFFKAKSYRVEGKIDGIGYVFTIEGKWIDEQCGGSLMQAVERRVDEVRNAKLDKAFGKA